jgi:hypothetical protein
LKSLLWEPENMMDDDENNINAFIENAELEWIANNPQTARFNEFSESFHWLRTKYDLKKFFTISLDYRVVYSYAVTLLEAFFSETAKHVVASDEKALINAAKYLDKINKKTYLLSDIVDTSSTKLVLTRVSELTFHNTKTINGFFSKVLETDINFPELKDVIDTRHDIVHRNGKRRNGDEIVLTIEDIEKTFAIIEDAAFYVHERVLKLEGID